MAHANPGAWAHAQARHHEMLRDAIAACGGHVFQVIGDAFCAAFSTVPDAAAAAIMAQRSLAGFAADQDRPAMPVLRVRMGIHVGAATAQPDGSYTGYLTLARTNRIMSAAAGGQTLLSQAAADLHSLAERRDSTLRDLGTHRLKDFAAPEHLYQLCVAGLPDEFPPLRTSEHPNNLPRQLTSFIGREAEAADLATRLTETPLLTLTGAGGVGKTRLALKIAGAHLDAFPDGVWFIELAPLSDGRLIANTLAAVVGVREETGRAMAATLGDYFRSKTTLLLLDNCEHVIDDASRVCDSLLHAAPSLKILATSREALGISGEATYRVPSLTMPATDMPVAMLSHVASVQLFSERAGAANSTFVISSANAAAVAQICRRLDGIPLAIELAAARVKVFTPEQIASRLDDRFRLLTGGSRTALPRHRTLRGAVDWSYGLLGEPERVLLRRLSIFAGSWTFEAAEAVCVGDGLEAHGVLDLLTHLVDKSLVVVETVNGEARYRMLESVRQYGREKLLGAGETELARRQHLDYFVRLSETAESLLEGPNQKQWFMRLDAEIDNLRASLDYAWEDGRHLAAIRLAAPIVWFWYIRLHVSEGVERIRGSLERADAAHALSRGSALRCRALLAQGFLTYWAQNRVADGRPVVTEALAIASSLDDRTLMFHAHHHLGSILARLGEFGAAQAHLAEGLRLASDMQDWKGVGEIQHALGDLEFLMGNEERAEANYRAALEHVVRAADRVQQTYIFRRLGYLALRRGDPARATEMFGHGLAFALDFNRTALAPNFIALAALSANGNELDRGACLLGIASHILEGTRMTLLTTDAVEFERLVADVSARLGRTAYAAAFARGNLMSDDEAVAFALEAGIV